MADSLTNAQDSQAVDLRRPFVRSPIATFSRDHLLVLPLIAALLYGGYFASDSVRSAGGLLVSELGLSRADIGLLYGVYSWPNVVMVLFGGMLSDRIGVRRASLLYSALIVPARRWWASPSLFAGSGSGRAVFYGMVVGRTLRGLGAESLAVCQNAMILRWFRGKQIALAFALTLTMARLGSLVSFSTEASIAEHFWRRALRCGRRPALPVVGAVQCLFHGTSISGCRWNRCRAHHRSSRTPPPPGRPAWRRCLALVGRTTSWWRSA